MKNSIWITLIIFFLFSCKGHNQSKSIKKNLEATESKIPTTSASKLGIDSLLLNNITTKIEEQVYPNIHSILIAKNGELFYEHYFNGQDQIWGRHIGTVQFSDSTLHDIRSITKSIVSACIGIAIEKGYIKNVNQKISDFFPEMDSIFSEDKENWTIQNFLTMSTGLIWNEDVPYDNPKNNETQMSSSEDPIKYVLSQPLETKPGIKFNYNGGATQILADIIVRSSKTPLYKFVEKHLFNPLGISTFEWTKFSAWKGSDTYAAASGLRLTSRDLLKFGLLYRNNGKWNGKQIIPSEWITESFSEKIEFPSRVADGNDAYGYQFWMWPDSILNNNFKMIAAIGNGGQNIYWDLKNDIIVVTTAGNYNKWDLKNDAYALLRNEIYPLILN
ncbi:CubicO group peptidase, beta-lactamase class C family [Flaviramulus basaltis]|uniref:CubicO group peptidase, beta-lactamase class C family n=1 Tax=Flaviramulus basaltis TaxID=369401 RepID=A0A1K2IHW0_9FLAO|nr:serine hydrolase [Flaviramulus basaltis]SFZ91858.1 CubicO group peptidase, beta-lactamase class C family [Flaviramulus basaltis]